MTALLADLRALAEGWRQDGPTDEPGLTIFIERVLELATKHETQPDIATLVDRSSLGAPEAKALRATVSDEQAAKVLERARELSERDELAQVIGRELGCVRKGQVDGYSMCGEHHYGWLSTGECPTQERVTDAILAAGFRRR